MSSFVGLDPTAVRAAAFRLESVASKLESAHDLARTGLGLADLVEPRVLRRLVERQENLVAVAAELRGRADAVERARVELNSHIATHTVNDLATRGLESVDTLTELNARISDWSGSDNDPLLDRLIAQRAELHDDLGAAAAAQIQGITSTAISELARRLDLPLPEARRIIEQELARPYVMTKPPGLYQSIGDQTDALLGSRPASAEVIVALMLAGEITVTTFVAGSAKQALIDPSGLDPQSLATYLALLAEREHTVRLAYDYTLDIDHPGQAQLDLHQRDLELREFESHRFGVNHSGVGGPGIHTMLDIAGMVPVVGEWADGLNAAIYAVEGDWVNASISAAALVPVAGNTATGARLIHKGTQLADRLGGTILNTLQAADGTLIHRIRRFDGAVINVVETSDGRTVHNALMGTNEPGQSFIANGATVHHTPTATGIEAAPGDRPVSINLERSRGAAGHDVIVHGELLEDGSATFITNGMPTHTRQIADAILENPNYNIGDPIQLATCHGACGLADELSKALGGVTVTASPHPVWIDPDTGLLHEVVN